MSRHPGLFGTATRYALLEHARNRFATFLVAVYVPVIIVLVWVTVRAAPVTFVLQATGRRLSPHGNQLTAVMVSLNAVTIITGFMMFAVTFAGGPFDRRLAMAGYPRYHLVLAKLTALLVSALTVSVYATAVDCALWKPRQPLMLAVALLCAGLTYGALGVALGSLLRKEVEGMFAVALTSVIDMAMQNPLYTSGSSSPVIRFLPSYGAFQTAAAGSFSATELPGHLLLQLSWFTAVALVGLLAFHRRTRNTLPGAAAFAGSRHRDARRHMAPSHETEPSRT